MNTFNFGSYTSSSCGLTLEKRPAPTVPEVRKTVYRVAGRADDVYEFEGTYNNITLVYSVGCSNIDNNLEYIKKMVSQLGYCKLSDTYNSNGFRRAFVNNAVKFTEDLLNFGHAEIEFSADPYFYLNSGETETTIASGTGGTTLTAPNDAISKPLITATGTAGSQVTLFIGSKQYNFKIPTGKTSIVIDSADETAYSGADNEIKFYLSDEFPIITATSQITYTGASALKIKPRWMKL